MAGPNELFREAPDAARAPFLAAVHERWRAALAGSGDSLEDVQAARQWGVREVRIHWVPAKP